MSTKTEGAATANPTDRNDSDSPVTRQSRLPDSRPAADGSAAQATNIELDDAHVLAAYANFCRVSSTPEELILDLGLNPQPMNPSILKVTVSQRTIMNHYTAKRLLAALSTALQRHESAFGVLETDVRRRVRGA